MGDHTRAALLAALLMVGTAACAYAQLAISANDAKVKLVDGKVEVQKNPPPDTVTFIDLRANPPKVLAEMEIPNSVAGPPSNVAIAPKEEIALVTSNMVIDAADPTKQIADDRVTVIDLTALKPSLVGRLTKAVGLAKNTKDPAPRVLATLKAGKGPAGIAINKAGTLALVANRGEGTVSVFTINGKTVAEAGKVRVGELNSSPSAIAIFPDGKGALVTLGFDNKIKVLSIDGSKVDVAPREIRAGLRPNGIEIAPKGEVAVVANGGMANGDADTISVIDLKLEPPRVVNTYTVGQTPEGLAFSPDGKFVAVVVINGTNRPAPFNYGNSLLQVWARNGTQLTKTGELALGQWCQGVAWSANSRTLLVQCMVDEEISVIRFSGLTGKSLQKMGAIKTKGGPAGIRTVAP
jgi:DNA-binding beta-propeller fold protein YncE